MGFDVPGPDPLLATLLARHQDSESFRARFLLCGSTQWFMSARHSRLTSDHFEDRPSGIFRSADEHLAASEGAATFAMIILDCPRVLRRVASGLAGARGADQGEWRARIRMVGRLSRDCGTCTSDGG